MKKLKGNRRPPVKEKDGDIVVHPATPSFYERTYGVLKGGGLLKGLKEFRREERDRKDKRVEKH